MLLWNLEETARQLGGIHPKTVRTLIARGELPSVRIGRRILVSPEAVATWIAHNQQARPAQEVQACHSTNAAASGGSASQRQMAEKYANLLKLPINDRRRNTTTTARPTPGDK
jgi:excisionase family DNA binding protein